MADSTNSTPDASSTRSDQGSPVLKMVAPLEPGMVCLDMERMLRFYSGLLGLELVSDIDVPAEVARRIHISPYDYRIVRLQTSYGERIKLIQSKAPSQPHSEYDYVCECHGLAYLTFIISNMNEVLPKLAKENVQILSDGIVEVRKGVFALFAQDPEGNFVELVDYPDISSYRPDLVPPAQSA
jgi:catechol 2,3-dioxygenase-like lactoylglutathione lyase family enzyme